MSEQSQGLFERAILHLDMDAFFVAVECLKNSSLIGKPLIVGGTSGRGVVASCSYEARRLGIRSAMPMRQALQLCPDALVLRGDMESYSKYSNLVREVVEAESPLYEQMSVDEFYVDLTGMDKYVGSWKWSTELRQKIIKEVGLPLSISLSANKTVSKVGTSEAKPSGQLLVPAGTEKPFLAPLPIGKLPSIGTETERRLIFMGVRKIQTLAEVPPRLLEREFGKNGLSIWKKANGLDDSPVVPYRAQDSMSTEDTFHSDTIDMRFLQDKVREQVKQLGFELRQLNKLTSCITVKIRYSDFNTFTRQMKVPYTASDRILTENALHIFEKLFERRQLVRLVGVRFSGLVHGNTQLNLFDDTEKETKLLEALDKIRLRWGKKAI
jgi:DNA polymerase IV